MVMSSIFNSNSVLLLVLTGLACSRHSVRKMKLNRRKEGFGQVIFMPVKPVFLLLLCTEHLADQYTSVLGLY